MLLVISIMFFFHHTLPCQESVFLQTEDGWKIHLKFTKPKKEDLPLLFLVHSQKENYTEWKGWFSIIESFGYGWAAIDLRGHGVSVYKTDGSSQTYNSFSLSGNDNEYNKMIRDIDTAIIHLSSVGVHQERIFLIGSHLGANVVAKFSVINKNTAGTVLINPYTTINDIPIIGLLRNYGSTRPLLIVTPENNIKRIRDTILIYNLTKPKTDPSKTFIIISGNFTSPKNMSKRLIYTILHWINTPYLPQRIDIQDLFQTTISSPTTNLTPAYLVIED